MNTAPRTHRKSGTQTIRMAKANTAREAIGTIQRGRDVFILTFGQFNLIDVLVAILDQTGPAQVDITTWTAGDEHLRRSAELIESAGITQFRMVVDRSFESRQPEYCHHMRRLFGPSCLRAIRTHAKFLIIRAKSHQITVLTSMNLNENPRLENVEICENEGLTQFMTSIVDQIFQEVAPGDNRSHMLHLEHTPDTFAYQEIEARQIPRESLNEPETTHNIKTG